MFLQHIKLSMKWGILIGHVFCAFSYPWCPQWCTGPDIVSVSFKVLLLKIIFNFCGRSITTADSRRENREGEAQQPMILQQNCIAPTSTINASRTLYWQTETFILPPLPFSASLFYLLINDWQRESQLYQEETASQATTPACVGDGDLLQLGHLNPFFRPNLAVFRQTFG
jgi:hypothetical protein